MSLAPGTRLGPYEIGALLGAGGMGEVYRARDTKLTRDVAIKVLSGTLAAGDPERLKRFDREARLLAALNHPGIAQIHGFEELQPAGQPAVSALILELVDGPTLADRIAKGPLSIETKISKKPIPEPPRSSAPDQLTGKLAEVVVGEANGLTLLVGSPASMVLKMAGVSSGALVSKTTWPWASSRVPVGAPDFARIV